MKSSFKAAALLLLHSLTCAALAVPTISPDRTLPDHLDAGVVGWKNEKDVFVRFEAPCQGCFVGTNNGLLFELQTHTSDVACGRNQITLNGERLTHTWDGIEASGSGIIKAELSNGLGSRDIHATWRTSCVFDTLPKDGSNSLGEDVAQILTLTINQIGQEQVSSESGFTISFIQLGQPEILRLSPTPIAHIQDVEGWRNPSRSQRLPIAPLHPDGPSPAELDEQFHRLDELEAQSRELHHQIKQQKHKIFHLLKLDCKAFTAQLKQCDSISCLFKTAVAEGQKVVQLVSAHIGRPPPGPPERLEASKASHHGPSPASKESSSALVTRLPVASEELGELSSPEAHVSHDELDHLPPSSKDDFNFGGPPSDDDFSFGGPPSSDDDFSFGTPPSSDDDFNFGGPPPLPEGHGTPPPPPPPPPHSPEHDHPPPPPPSHHPEHPHHPPRRLHTFIKTLKICAVLIGLTTFLGLLFKRLHHCCISPQRRLDRLARREERRTRRAYRRAACRHRLSQWFKRTRSSSNNDYEEKRAMILDQEGRLEAVMEDEIHSLRIAHEIVGDMVRAEEGRSTFYRRANLPPHSQATFTPVELEAATASISRTPSLPSYHTHSDAGSSSNESPPPRYEEELEGEITVVDGFQYTPSNTESTASSSVVSYSPRMSMATRYSRKGDDDDVEACGSEGSDLDL